MSGYNGWKNYETWCVKLWLDNDEWTYRDMVGKAKAIPEVYSLAEEIREYVERAVPLTGASMFVDLLEKALCEVDWYEIAEAYHNYYEEEEDE